MTTDQPTDHKLLTQITKILEINFSCAESLPPECDERLVCKYKSLPVQVHMNFHFFSENKTKLNRYITLKTFFNAFYFSITDSRVIETKIHYWL